MMRVVFDLQALQNGSRGRGIGRYVLQLFHALARQPKVELFGLLNAGLAEHFDEARLVVEEALGKNRVLVLEGLTPGREIEDDNEARRIFTEAAYEQFLASLSFDALLVGSLFEGFEDETVTSLKGSGYPKFVILYDLIPLLYPDQYMGWDKARRWYDARLSHLAAADGLLAISESARQEAIQHLKLKPGKVFTIGTATDPEIFHDRIKRKSSVLRQLRIDRPFVMHASAFEERKNFEGLVKAFAKLALEVRRRHQLVLAGNANKETMSRLREIAEGVGLDPGDVVFTGYVDDATLAQLYRHCSLFVFPSFHEGFGLPALEAMSCGCATIGSDRSSIPEVIGRSDLLFDPANLDAMATLMESLLSSRGKREEAAQHSVAQAKRFSWGKVAAKATEAMAIHCSFGRVPSISLENTIREIAKKTKNLELGFPDRERFAQCLADNERRSVAQVGRLAAEPGPSWRIEGPFDSSYSLALINRETARALDALGFEVSLHSTEGPGDFEPSGAFLAANPDLAEFHSRSGRARSQTPDFASRLLYPPRVTDMNGAVKALHHYAWEESGFPQEWALDFNASLTMMTCLSRHVEKIMIDNGVTVPLLTSGCGVDHWQRIDADRRFRVQGKGFRFLHVSSCFPRKGVDLLLAAYGATFTSDDDVTLVIKTFENPHNEIAAQLERLQRDNPKYPDVNLIVADLSDAELKALYEQCDVMVGPSCAEGYGLPFAEAMLSGLPVITTNWGGQLDFCNDGNSWLVDYDFERAQTHFGLWSSAWARAKPGSLADAMFRARKASAEERRTMAERGRRQLLTAHKWSDVALRLAAATAVLPGRKTHVPNVGWMTTWGSRCGVATYSAHLTQKLGSTTTILAPRNEDHVPDGSQVVRCWTLAKESEGYDEVHRQCREKNIGVLVIQFNYTFYDHRQLARLIARCRDDDIRVVMTMHSTVDTPAEADPRTELYQLRRISHALAKCDRLLVHSIGDLNRLKLLGLVDNVALFPHGVLDVQRPRSRRPRKIETISSYGFALPNKGLEQLVEAVALLHQRGRRVRLRLVNAEYPADVSRQIVEKLQEQVKRLDLSGFVEHHHAFLPDEESLRLLQDSDLAVFAYQQSGESASGAVRYGMAAHVPVAVTPVPIFDDLGDAAFRFDGTDPQTLAIGIERFLDGLRGAAPEAVSMLQAADRWRTQHGYASIAKRLANMCTALANQAAPTCSISADWAASDAA
jgi:O-antigen biosynthesis alpha-1,2-mannosyltransferase